MGGRSRLVRCRRWVRPRELERPEAALATRATAAATRADAGALPAAAAPGEPPLSTSVLELEGPEEDQEGVGGHGGPPSYRALTAAQPYAEQPAPPSYGASLASSPPPPSSAVLAPPNPEPPALAPPPAYGAAVWAPAGVGQGGGNAEALSPEDEAEIE